MHLNPMSLVLKELETKKSPMGALFVHDGFTSQTNTILYISRKSTKAALRGSRALALRPTKLWQVVGLYSHKVSPQ